MVLTILLLMPLAAAALVGLLPARRVEWIRAVAFLAAALTLAYAWSLLGRFDTAAPGIQLFETHVWNPRLGSSFALGVDGISFPMVLLATLLTLVAVLASGSIRRGAKLYYLLILVLEAAMLGRLHGARLVAVLCLLGADPDPAVLPHRPPGRRQPQPRRAQLRALHDGRIGVHADRAAVPVRCRARPQLRHERPWPRARAACRRRSSC